MLSQLGAVMWPPFIVFGVIVGRPKESHGQLSEELHAIGTCIRLRITYGTIIVMMIIGMIKMIMKEGIMN